MTKLGDFLSNVGKENREDYLLIGIIPHMSRNYADTARELHPKIEINW